MLRRLPIGCVMIVLVGISSHSALADHNCCQTGLYCASSAGMTVEACNGVGGTFFSATRCVSSTDQCTQVKPIGENPAPICSDNAPPEECSALLDAGVPTVSEWGLATLLLLVLSAGTVMLLKRRDQVAA